MEGEEGEGRVGDEEGRGGWGMKRGDEEGRGVGGEEGEGRVGVKRRRGRGWENGGE